MWVVVASTIMNIARSVAGWEDAGAPAFGIWGLHVVCVSFLGTVVRLCLAWCFEVA